MKVYFTRPGNSCEIVERLKTDIINSKDRILMASYYLTEPEIIKSIKESRATIKRIILNQPRDAGVLKKNGIDSVVVLSKENTPIIMHHKFIILDDVIWVGSFNYSTKATLMNWENLIRIEDENLNKNLFKDFIEEFKILFLFGLAYKNSPFFHVPKDFRKFPNCPDCSKNVVDYTCNKHQFFGCRDCKDEIHGELTNHYVVEINKIEVKNRLFFNYEEFLTYEQELKDPDIGEYGQYDNSNGPYESLTETKYIYKLHCVSKEKDKKKMCSSCNKIFYKNRLHRYLASNEYRDYEITNKALSVYEIDNRKYKLASDTVRKESRPAEAHTGKHYCINCLYDLMNNIWERIED